MAKRLTKRVSSNGVFGRILRQLRARLVQTRLVKRLSKCLVEISQWPKTLRDGALKLCYEAQRKVYGVGENLENGGQSRQPERVRALQGRYAKRSVRIWSRNGKYIQRDPNKSCPRGIFCYYFVLE